MLTEHHVQLIQTKGVALSVLQEDKGVLGYEKLVCQLVDQHVNRWGGLASA
jgi:hypothetical protein